MFIWSIFNQLTDWQILSFLFQPYGGGSLQTGTGSLLSPIRHPHRVFLLGDQARRPPTLLGDWWPKREEWRVQIHDQIWRRGEHLQAWGTARWDMSSFAYLRNGYRKLKYYHCSMGNRDTRGASIYRFSKICQPRSINVVTYILARRNAWVYVMN